MNKPANVKLVVVVSDIHCGSIWGLMPPTVELDSGNTIRHGKNHAQIFLWNVWTKMWKSIYAIIGNEPFLLVVNGDATEGVHHGGKELVAIKMREHFQIAKIVLAPHVARAEDTIFIEGTECHTGDVEHDLAKVFEVRPAKSKALFTVNGCLIDATHHIGPTSRAYLEASAMSINAGNARLNSLRAGHKAAQVFLRGHRHCGGHWSDGAALLVITPAWQFLTRHGRKVVADSIPRPGGAVLDWRGKEHGALPTVHDLQYNPPQDEITNY